MVCGRACPASQEKLTSGKARPLVRLARLSDGMRRPVSAGCDTLPMFDVLEAQRKGDRQCRRLALCERVEVKFSKGASSPLDWIWEIVFRSTASWMKRAKSS